MRRPLVMLALLFAIATCLGFGSARGGDLPRDFATKYQPAAANMQKMYSNATIIGTLKREFPPQKKLLEQRYIYRAAGINLRLDVTTTADHDMGHVVNSSEAFIATGIGSLTAYTGPTSDVFDTATEISYSQAVSRIENGCPLLTPYKAVGQTSLLEILKLPSVKVDSVQKITIEGEPLVKVTYDESSGQRNQPAHRSWYVLSPAEGWAVREYSRSTGTGDNVVLHRGILKYDGMHDGVPLLSHIECWQEQGAKRVCLMRETVDISSFSPLPADDYWFTAWTF